MGNGRRARGSVSHQGTHCRERPDFSVWGAWKKAKRWISGFQPGMGAVAKRGFFTVLAPAPGHLLFIFDWPPQAGKDQFRCGIHRKMAGFVIDHIGTNSRCLVPCPKRKGLVAQ
jgi:hypothetical protein